MWMLAGELIIILISTEALMDLQEMSDLSSQQVYRGVESVSGEVQRRRGSQEIRLVVKEKL